MKVRDETGIALIATMMTMMLLMAIGTGLVLTTSSDSFIARNFREAIQVRHAAWSMAEVARDQLKAADWNAVLDGSVRSAFTDGAPNGVRFLAGGYELDLSRTLNLARCGKATSCSAADMNVRTARRPWGPDNPRWQLYAYGPFHVLTEGADAANRLYALAFVGDDGLERDGWPARDGDGEGNRGAGRLLIRAEAYSSGGARAAIEMTVRRVSENELQVVEWRYL